MTKFFGVKGRNESERLMTGTGTDCQPCIASTRHRPERRSNANICVAVQCSAAQRKHLKSARLYSPVA